MSPAEFAERWQVGNDRNSLQRFTATLLADVNLPVESYQFLVEAGLPTSAAPFLSFALVSERPLQTLSELWQLPVEYRRFRVIGFNGSGDPLCLDDDTPGAILSLNHERGLEQVLINSSVQRFAESLLVVRTFAESDATSELELACLEELQRIDPDAWNHRSFWQDEIAMMKD